MLKFPSSQRAIHLQWVWNFTDKFHLYLLKNSLKNDTSILTGKILSRIRKNLDLLDWFFGLLNRLHRRKRWLAWHTWTKSGCTTKFQTLIFHFISFFVLLFMPSSDVVFMLNHGAFYMSWKVQLRVWGSSWLFCIKLRTLSRRDFWLVEVKVKCMNITLSCNV